MRASRTASASCGGIFDLEAKIEELEEFEAQTADPSFWDNGDRAQVVLKEQALLKKLVDEIQDAGAAWEEGRDLYQLAREEQDPDSILEAWRKMPRVAGQR